MLEPVADKNAARLWRVLPCTAPLLVILLAILAFDALSASAPAAGQADSEVAWVTRTPLPADGAAAADSRPTSGCGPATLIPPAVTPTPTCTIVPATPARFPVGGPARGDGEAVPGLASQARWQRARPTATVALAPTELPLTPTPLLPAPVLAAQPPTRIVAPSIGLDARIVAVKWNKIWMGGRQEASWIVPKNQVGWHATSALPGQPGNTVLNGHRNMYAEVFRYIVDLKPGDPITIYAGDQAFVYYVDEMHVVQEVGVPQSVRAENARWIARTDDVRLTLITCAPYEAPGNTHRVIVVARP